MTAKPALNNSGWAVYRKNGTIAEVYASKKKPANSVIAWAWKYDNSQNEHSGVWLPKDYNEAHGELKSTKYHLEDMRKLLGIEDNL